MSKAVQSALAILVVLLIASVGLAVYTLLQKNTLEKENQGLQQQITDSQEKASKLLEQSKKIEKEVKSLTDSLSQSRKEKQDVQQMYDELKTKSDQVTEELNQITQDRDDWKNRLETIRRERDDLMEKIKNQPEKVVEKIVYKERELAAEAEASIDSETPEVTTPKGDAYWAQILKAKATLQLDLEKAKADLDQSVLQVVELKKQNADMQMELKNLTDSKSEIEHKMQETQEELERKIKYNEDLANNLSMEVARSRDEQKIAIEKAEKIKQENLDLQGQIKQLTSTKLALEKTIAKINQDKVVMQKKLTETEGVIQGRIDEIWQIKQNLDKKITDLPTKPVSGGVELSPIIVNGSGGQGSNNLPISNSGKVQGAVISINEPNNFAIVDLGESDASQVGRKLNVFRDNRQIGVLEIIQVRKDISAADIKQMSVKLKVGDVVRY